MSEEMSLLFGEIYSTMMSSPVFNLDPMKSQLDLDLVTLSKTMSGTKIGTAKIIKGGLMWRLRSHLDCGSRSSVKNWL
jgi:hypothetical protein